MATLTREKTGSWNIRFVDEYGNRQSVFLKRSYTEQSANDLKRIIETIIVCRDNNQVPDKRVFAYLETAPPEIRAKLEKVGLITQNKVRTLSTFLDDYVKERTDWKWRTVAAFHTSKDIMLTFFGKCTPIEKISVDDAVVFRLGLEKKYSEATVAKIIKHCRQVFNLARRRKWIADSPFETVKLGSQRNLKRFYFVSMDEYHKLLDGCTNAKQRLIISLARIGGLRCPTDLGFLNGLEIF